MDKCKYCGGNLSESRQPGGKPYCVPCWREWKNKHELKTYPDGSIEKMREWAIKTNETIAKVVSRIEILEKETEELSNLKTLMYRLAPRESVDLHSSMSGKPDGDIPVIRDKDEVRIEDMGL